MVPRELIPRRDEVIAAITKAFKGVSRKGGVSWHEADAIDDYVSDPKLLALERAKDTEARWEDLLDDPRWPDHLGHGSQWSFLDPIGFRYYLAPAMIQALRWPASFDFSFRLTVTDDYVLNQLKLLDPEQCRCARDFVLFMRDLGVQTEAYHDADTWQEAYDSHWYQF